MYGWDTERMMHLAGGPTGMRALCAEVAPAVTPPSVATTTVWRGRGRIPQDWLPVVVRGLLARGHHYSVLTRELFDAAAPAAPLQEQTP